MKNVAILFSFLTLLLVAACGSDSTSNTDTTGASGDAATGTLSGGANSPTVMPAAPDAPMTAPAPAAATGGVEHYVCPKGCKGGGGPAQANCPACGTAFVHNQAFHAQDPKNAASPTQMPTPTPAPAGTPEPAQNAAGVWHYTCGKGCAGGAGAAGNCAKCGGPLSHNTAYHSK